MLQVHVHVRVRLRGCILHACHLPRLFASQPRCCHLRSLLRTSPDVAGANNRADHRSPTPDKSGVQYQFPRALKQCSRDSIIISTSPPARKAAEPSQPVSPAKLCLTCILRTQPLLDRGTEIRRRTSRHVRRLVSSPVSSYLPLIMSQIRASARRNASERAVTLANNTFQHRRAAYIHPHPHTHVHVHTYIRTLHGITLATRARKRCLQTDNAADF